MLHFHADGILWKLYRWSKRGSPKKAGDNIRIGFIGAGKVGFSLGKYFAEHNVHVSGYYSRNLASSKEAADFTHSKYYENIEDLIIDSDTLFLTVSDRAISKVYSEIKQFNLQGKILAHCSGALTSDVFSGISQKGAFGCSVHPICAVSSKQTGYQELSKAYFTIEGNENRQIFSLIQKCGNPVEMLSDVHKVKYHGAAVFASNLVIALYRQATELMKECGLSREFSEKALEPLFLQNCENIVNKGMILSLTGPVERGDEDTIAKHLSVLQDEERILYQLLSSRLLMVAKEKNPERNYEKLEKILEKNLSFKG